MSSAPGRASHVRTRLALATAAIVLAISTSGCARLAAPEAPTSPSPSAFRPSVPPGDDAPHYGENNGWKERHNLSPVEQHEGDALAARIRPRLTALRKAGTVTPDVVESALLDLKIPQDRVVTEAFHTPADAGTPPPGTVFAVTFPENGCVIGSVTPGRVQVEVTGAAAEFGCLEPYTH